MKQFLLFFLLPFSLFSQEIKGRVLDRSTGEAIVGVKIQSSENQKILSDSEGNFKLTYSKLPITLVASYMEYYNDTLVIKTSKDITVKLKPMVNEVGTVVVSAGRRKQDVEEVAISMEILKPTLLDNKGVTDLEQAVDQSPGVYAMDGQVSIRGGSGFAYGAGSRVLVLWNGTPLISGDAGDAKWNAIPVETASQIEIMKGASSVLYGSGALNGVISLTEREPDLKGETRFKIQSGVYGNPRRESLKWWSTNPMMGMVEAYHGKMYRNFGFTISANGFKNQGFREGEVENRGRVSGTLFFRTQKIKNLKAGIGYNFQIQKGGVFIIWESDSAAYQPLGGADTSNTESTLVYNLGIRTSIDPYIKYIDKYKNVHNLKTRLYHVNNIPFNNMSQSSKSYVYFADYQFQRTNQKGGVFTGGTSVSHVIVNSQLFGEHFSLNNSLYGQYEHKIGKFTLTGGVRLEYFEQDGRPGDSDYYLGKDSLKLPITPILRTAATYKLLDFTFLRASFGQGVRYPAVSERFTSTSVGSLNVFPNPGLKRETGWAAELGIKQGVKIGKNWKGLLDVAGFINQYDNMMEFVFGIYNPLNGNLLDPTNPADLAIFFDLQDQGFTINDMVGFRSQNSEKARITGVEFSFNSEGKINNVDVRTLIGYTYMNPISLNNDSTYRETFSDSTTDILKYRFRHLAKADVEVEYKGISAGLSLRYNSFMNNIDKVFEGPLPGTSTEILPGLKEYRQNNQKGQLAVDMRFGYKINEHYRAGFMINNLLNAEIMTRPGDIQAPRTFVLQLQMKF